MQLSKFVYGRYDRVTWPTSVANLQVWSLVFCPCHVCVSVSTLARKPAKVCTLSRKHQIGPKVQLSWQFQHIYTVQLS